MHLLRTSTSEPTLEYFGSSTPPYAILSHRWGDDEVLFQDVINDAQREAKKRKGGAGWKKMEASRRFAHERGFNYIWNDTCCINKESSAELTESINSMFKYYAESSLCIAYISDVPGNLKLSVQREVLKQSQWFTRGWTLQELVAPLDVIFVNAEWVEIGLKSNMKELIQETTGISSEGLCNPLSPNISVAAKMSWAARRETTREEDMAYCLMGLFLVNIPPLYGEGSYNAFLRLQLEIIKLGRDRSIFAWRACSNDLNGRGLLANSPQEFIDSGNVRFVGESQLGILEHTGGHQPEREHNESWLTALMCCLFCGCCCALCSLLATEPDDTHDREEHSRQVRILQVDPTYTMTNAHLHIHFPFRRVGYGAAAYLSCFLDDSESHPLWIHIQNVGNRQFQRVEANKFYHSVRPPSSTEIVQEMYFQQPQLDRHTSRMWMTSAKRSMFVVPQSLTSVGKYKFMKNSHWHLEHSSGKFLSSTCKAPGSSWCLPFHDAANQRGFIISVRVDPLHRMLCGISPVASASTEVMIDSVKSYWEACILESARERENHGDRAFFIIDEGIVSVLVRNVTKSFEWKEGDMNDIAIFAIDVTLINDSTLTSLLKAPSALHPNISSDLIFRMDFDQDYRLILYRERSRQEDLGNHSKLLSVPKENLPILMTLHDSFRQVGIILGSKEGRIWVDTVMEPDFGQGESFPDRQKVNNEYVHSEIKGRGQED
ncbi:hypothetical protein VKT23_018475 [Stygiomarasmius scandens]|uniref:Heterokaryon incompatibility domain-containing protein n=1 Tax=Marasmiellus scandens TaxID=2682957 RepID=A0ABR1INX5_9AGAR